MYQNWFHVISICLGVCIFLSISYYFLPKNQHQESVSQMVPIQSKPVAIYNAPDKHSNITRSELKTELKTDETMQLKSKIKVLQATLADLHREIDELKAYKMPYYEEYDEYDEYKDYEEKPFMPMDIDEMEAQRKQEENEVYLQADNNFSLEQIDYNWSAAVTERIEKALYDEKYEGLAVDYIECRSSMCKLEFENMDENEMEIFRDDFRHKVSDIFTSGMVRQDEMGKTIVFMSKNHETFDVIPQQ